MNTVTQTPQKKEYCWVGTLGNLIGKCLRADKTAFIGRVGNGDEEQLYLITYLGINRANCPGRTWGDERCDVKVMRFVDVNITVVERDD